MAARQGLRRILEGVTRTLTKHELERGYVYVTLDKALHEAFDVTDFTASLNGQPFEHRRISVSGRVHIPTGVLKAIGTETQVRIKAVDGRLEINSL